ncbi:sugar kinase, ribokinase [Thioflavicoccus mobilis 8321]|uniref:Sugar kinase, ribokinase n=1 Tax=Thioflavicoccus mobilis 8321 TaxID=765912 RepID=L0H052_9GAMM|nr:PfkB family carbohydrate kinase [Thioflavicoccus mobilis]AGA90954.1 sugar kinase, ribokinase [Thioflavicoccus mobilis 8321]
MNGRDRDGRPAGDGAGSRELGAVLGVGIATLDIVNEVATYPAEDAEVRAQAQRRVRGGNVTNSLVVLAQLGHRCRWVGTLGEDAAAEAIIADLARYQVATDDAVRVAGGTTPTSYIALSRASGSRTIVHFRDLPELDAAAFERVALDGVGWVHFEGRNPPETRRMIERVRAEYPAMPISLELEKPRPGLDSLLDGPQVLLASRAFAAASGFRDPAAFLADLAPRTSATLCIVAWGEEGASWLARGGPVQQAPVHRPPRVIDTIGAGDVFNAGVIDALVRGLATAEAVAAAVHLAGEQCGRIGLMLKG